MNVRSLISNPEAPRHMSIRALPNVRKAFVVSVVIGFIAVAAGLSSQVLTQPAPLAHVDPTHVDNFAGKPRVIVISDIGNEPDDQMSLVRLLLYSNELDIEALVASTSTWQRTVIHPETMRTLIDAYAQIRPNLLLHAPGWPDAADLARIVYPGQTGYGLAATGAGKSSPGHSESKPLLRMLSRIVFQYHAAASGLVVSMSDPARSYGRPSIGVPSA